MKPFGLSNGFSFAIVVLAVLLSASRSDAQTSGPSKTLVILGGTLIDATGRPPLENAVIVIEGERIKAVGKQGEITFPKDSRVINVRGKTRPATVEDQLK
jgi:hypothetical protein